MRTIIELNQLIDEVKIFYKEKNNIVLTKKLISFLCWLHYEKLLHIERYPKYIDLAYSKLILLLWVQKCVHSTLPGPCIKKSVSESK